MRLVLGLRLRLYSLLGELGIEGDLSVLSLRAFAEVSRILDLEVVEVAVRGHVDGAEQPLVAIRLRDVRRSADPTRSAECLVRLLVAARGSHLQLLRSRFLREDASDITGVARVRRAGCSSSGWQSVVRFLRASLAVRHSGESDVLVAILHHVGYITTMLTPLILGCSSVLVLWAHVG